MSRAHELQTGKIVEDNYHNIIIVSDYDEVLAVGCGITADEHIGRFWKKLVGKKCEFFTTVFCKFKTYSFLKYARITRMIDIYDDIQNRKRSRIVEEESELDRFLKQSRLESKCKDLEKRLFELNKKYNYVTEDYEKISIEFDREKEEHSHLIFDYEREKEQHSHLIFEYHKLENKYQKEKEEYDHLDKKYETIKDKYNLLDEDYDKLETILNKRKI
jgi:hypothetical protein